MELLSHTMDLLFDPTGIIEGERFEFFINFTVDEDDELYEANGLELRVLIGKKDENIRLITYHIRSIAKDTQIDIALDEDEEAEILAYCSAKITEQ
ncbi:DUF6509 family protein [Brochothrix campestris]|uniref:Pullulanase n=1 Tax=Brochothrix campestris FSL F6-1037 TaxID=1265861 RepID=W7CWM5_9LIST|nr:DUF6509 family protein [Brochothrix campestris]EUJ40181.1 hypothetical protein BCAMP_05821 [Brochothrix campestris FSL F6-1037]